MIRSGMTRRIVLSVVAPTVVACAAALVGCDTEGEDITTETGASFSSSIHGIACGILYQNNSQLIVDGACDNVRTAGFNPPPGWPWICRSSRDFRTPFPTRSVAPQVLRIHFHLKL